MTAEARRPGAENVRIVEVAADPAAVADQVQVYGKDVLGVTQLFARASDGTIEQISGGTAASTEKGVYGDGSDGDVVLGAGTTTLTRNMYYNNLTVPSGSSLNVDGYIPYVKETLTTVDGTSIIFRDGVTSTGSAGATAPATARPLDSAGNGANSNAGNGSNAVASANNPRTFAGTGGAGGTDGVRTGGTGGAVTNITADAGDFRTSPLLSFGCTLARGVPGYLAMRGGAGGGGGAGNGALVGGGGGSGAPPMVIPARTIVHGGIFRTKGGGGRSATNANTSGGGGGGGGVIVIITEDYSGAGTTDVTGGPGGAGNGIGGAGVDGNPGMVIGPIPG